MIIEAAKERNIKTSDIQNYSSLPKPVKAVLKSAKRMVTGKAGEIIGHDASGKIFTLMGDQLGVIFVVTTFVSSTMTWQKGTKVKLKE